MNSLFKMCFMRNHIRITNDSYECFENFILIIDDKINWFFRLDVFETIYDEKILHEKCQNRFWSIYSFWFSIIVCIRNSFTKLINSNQFLKTFAIVFVRKRYSYESNVNDLNWLLFKIAISWLEIWNEIALNSTKSLFFKLIFILQLVMQNFLRQRLMTSSTKFVIENSLLLLFIAWSLKFA